MGTHTYEIIVRSTPEQIWQALTDGNLTQRYYFNTRVESDWKTGSAIRYRGPSGSIDLDGEILEIDPQSRLTTTFKPNWIPNGGGTPSKLTWQIQSMGPVSNITLIHSDIDDATFEAGQMHMGWVYGLSSLKSLLETGEGLPDIFASGAEG